MGVLRLGVVTDLHLSPPGTPDGLWNNPMLRSRSGGLLERVAAELADAQVDHVIVLGDVTEMGDRSMGIEALTACREAGAPVWVVPGNHDVAAEPLALSAAADQVAGVGMLSPTSQALGPWTDIAGPRLVSQDGGVTCRVAQLPPALDSAAPLLVWASHYPVLSGKPWLHRRGLRYPGDMVNRRVVQSLIGTRVAPTLVLHGHLHASLAVTHGQTLQIGCSALVEWPHAWTLITVEQPTPDSPTVAVERRALDTGPPPVADTVFMPAHTRWRCRSGNWHAEQSLRSSRPPVESGRRLHPTRPQSRPT